MIKCSPTVICRSLLKYLGVDTYENRETLDLLSIAD